MPVAFGKAIYRFGDGVHSMSVWNKEVNPIPWKIFFRKL